MSLAHEYAKAFRIWPMGVDKAPLAAGFSADRPQATCRPEDLDPALPVGILCGPLHPSLGDTGFHILGLDLDKAMDRSALEAVLGPLPETLTSKNWRHAYYWIPSDHPLHQRNAALVCDGGQLDIRPCAGGYLVEKGDWDGPFDLSRIAEFPTEAMTKLHKAIGEKRKRDGAPAVAGPVQIADRDREIADKLSQFWAHSTTGDLAFGGLGGWLARRGVSRDRAVMIAARVAEQTQSTHPDPVARVEQAYDGSCPLGRPAVQKALSRDADEADVVIVLSEVETLLKESVAGFEQPAPAPVITSEPPPNRFIGWQGLMEPLGEVPWLVKDLELCPGRPPMFISDSGVGKTWTLQALALAVATGQPVFGRFACRKGPVLHLSRDSGLRATKARYQRLARGMGIDRADVVVFPHNLPLTDKFGTFTRAGFEEVAREATRGKYALVILDSLAALCPGIDENSTEIGDPLRATTDDECVWLWAHHTTKNGENYRGSGAIKGAAGAVYVGSRSGEHAVWKPMKASEEHETGDLPTFYTEWQVDPDGAARVVWVPDPNGDKANESPALEAQKAAWEMLRLLSARGKASATELLAVAGATPGVKGRVRTRANAVLGALAHPSAGLIQHVEGEKYILAPGVTVPAAAHQIQGSVLEIRG